MEGEGEVGNWEKREEEGGDLYSHLSTRRGGWERVASRDSKGTAFY